MRTPAPLLVLFTFLPATAFPEPAPTAYRLDLSGCISLALKQSPRLKPSAHDIALAKARLKEARSGRKPRLEVTNVTGAVPEARGDVTASPDKITDTDNLGAFNRLEINLIQPLYTFGKIGSYIDAALHGLEAERARRAQSADEVIYETKLLYYSLLLNRQLVALLGETADNFQKAHDRFEKLIEDDEGDGDYSMLDFIKLKVGLSEVSYNHGKVRRAEELTKAALVEALGIGPEADIDVKDTGLLPQANELRSLDFYVAETFKNRPEWSQLEAGIRAKKSLLSAAKRNYYPNLFVAVPFRYAVAPNRDDQKNPFVSDELNELRGGPVVGLRWEFSLGGTRAKIEQAEEELKKLLAQRDQATTGFPVEIRKALLEVQELKERLDATNKTRKAARSLVASSAGIRELGVQDLKELFETYGLYTKTTSDYYLAVHGYNLALARLSKAVGFEVAKLSY